MRGECTRTAALRVGFVLAPQFTITAFAGFIDAIRLASDELDRSGGIDCRWEVLSATREPIPSSCGVPVHPTGSLQAPARFDYIVAVGGLLHGGQKVGTGTYAFLQSAAAAGVPLIGLCTGSFILARAGLLDGYQVCVSWLHREEFMLEFPELRVRSDTLFVVDRDRMTSAGGTSVVHLAAQVIERHLGRARALKSLRIMIEDEPLPANAWQPEQIVTHRAQDALVRRAMLIIEQNLSGDLSLPHIADTLGISLRQLERRFAADVGLTPRDYRSRLRLSRAAWMIVHTDHPMTAIALECGYSDSAHLARSFRHGFAMTPSGVRRQRRRGRDARPSQ